LLVKIFAFFQKPRDTRRKNSEIVLCRNFFGDSNNRVARLIKGPSINDVVLRGWKDLSGGQIGLYL